MNGHHESNTVQISILPWRIIHLTNSKLLVMFSINKLTRYVMFAIDISMYSNNLIDANSHSHQF